MGEHDSNGRPFSRRPVLWHQDGAFWPLEPMEVVTDRGYRPADRPPAGATQITILQAEAIVLDLERIEDPYDSLDADSQELEAYGCLFDLATGELHPDLEALLGIPLGQHVVIAERARVAPAWRGCGGVGRYLTGRLFRHMCCDPVVVATQPFPLDIARDQHGRADEAALKPALRQIQRTWESIGFQPYKVTSGSSTPAATPTSVP